MYCETTLSTVQHRYAKVAPADIYTEVALTGMLGDESGHQSDAAFILHDLHPYSARAQQVLLAEKRAILTDDDVWNPVEQDGTAAHRAR